MFPVAGKRRKYLSRMVHCVNSQKSGHFVFGLVNDIEHKVVYEQCEEAIYEHPRER